MQALNGDLDSDAAGHQGSKIDSRRGPELVIGLVGALGADLGLVARLLTEELRQVSYETVVIRLSALLAALPGIGELREAPLDVRIEDRMRAGTMLRKRTGRSDAMALLGVTAIRQRRGEEPDAAPKSRCVYVLRSLKRPEEVESLRTIYGAGFLVVSAYSPRETRVETLAKEIAESRDAYQPSSDDRQAAEKLIDTDERELTEERGQNVRDTFPKADVFIDVSQREEQVQHDIERFVALLFGYPFHTPTRDEHAMFHAQASALRSAEFGRQVGAAVTLATGEVVALGVNEVPQLHGGPYWPPRNPSDEDRREFTLHEDTSERMKRSNLAEVLEVLRKRGLLSNTAQAENASALLNRCLPLMKQTRLMAPIEFGRAVHAEMDAITEAARRGVAVGGCTLYTTTFPCHNCARHIVAAGIVRVVYIEPYAKSLASEFHKDSIAVDSPTESNAVAFVPFVGIAPRAYAQLFRMVKRKNDDDGNAIAWDRSKALPRLYPSVLPYIAQEVNEVKLLKDAMDAAGMTS